MFIKMPCRTVEAVPSKWPPLLWCLLISGVTGEALSVKCHLTLLYQTERVLSFHRAAVVWEESRKHDQPLLLGGCRPVTHSQMSDLGVVMGGMWDISSVCVCGAEIVISDGG